MFIRASFLPTMHELQLIRDSAALKHLFETHADPDGIIRIAENEMRGKGPAISHGLQYGKLRYVGKDGETLLYADTASQTDRDITAATRLPERAQAL